MTFSVIVFHNHSVPVSHHSGKFYTVECRYNAVQFITILHTALRWQQQNRLQTHNTHPIPRPHGRAMGCLLWEFKENWPHFNGTAPYLVSTGVRPSVCSRWADWLHIKFNGTVMTRRCAWSSGRLTGLSRQAPQILLDAVTPRWTDSPHRKLYGTVLIRRDAPALSLARRALYGDSHREPKCLLMM